jgi:hypothetical protein
VSKKLTIRKPEIRLSDVYCSNKNFIFCTNKHDIYCCKIWAIESKGKQVIEEARLFLTLLDLTDVCPFLTKQYIQVGLQILHMFFVFFKGYWT